MNIRLYIFSFSIIVLSFYGCSSKVEKIETKSGAAIYAFHDNSTQLIHLNLVIQSAGTLSDPIDKEGVSSITAVMMKAGTKSFSKNVYQGILDKIGGSLNIDTDTSGMIISGTFMKEKALEYLSVLRSILTEPIIDTEDLNIEIEKRKNFITNSMSNNIFLIDYFYHKTWFNNHPYGRSGIGTFKSLANIKHEDILNFFTNNIAANTTIAGVSGDLSDGSTITTLQQILESFGKNKALIPEVAEVSNKTGRKLYLIDKPNRTINNMYVVFNIKKLNFSDKNYIKINLANEYLNKEINSFLDINNAGGSLLVKDSATNDKLAQSIKNILKVYSNFVSRGLVQKDLDKEKTSALNKSLFKEEVTSLYMENFIKQLTYKMPETFNNTFTDNVSSVKLTDLNAAIAQHFDNNPNNYSVYLVSSSNQLLSKQLQQENLFDSIEVIQYDSMLKD